MRDISLLDILWATIGFQTHTVRSGSQILTLAVGAEAEPEWRAAACSSHRSPERCVPS